MPKSAASKSKQSSQPPPPSPHNKKKASGTTFSLLDKSKKNLDILQGLVLHKEVISSQFENELISFIQSQCTKGRSGQLKKPTYLRSAGARSQGNQREALQYGGFFDFNKARPGKRGLVPDFPPIVHRLVNHLIDEGYLDKEVRPDSCIINQYGKGDCIPPHVDHESYYRPISTLSLLGEEPMLVGTKFQTVKSCTWKPTVGTSVTLPRRSLLLLGGNSGNVSKHCISSCRGERISITLRKQPGPDWRPSLDELAKSGGGKKRKRDAAATSTANDYNNDDDGGGGDGAKKKKKALSGSAKRRKKMMKLKGITTTLPESGQGDASVRQQQQQQQHQQQMTQSQSSSNGEKTSTKKRSSDTQAKRNARRLERKQKQATANTK
mmetsp:Transcript_4544/g.9427  ORF Transcript_4544/g.9427 Transcript_4544/m.9427 type:complete len:380 (+) Transcript_4544:307-1446(+)